MNPTHLLVALAPDGTEVAKMPIRIEPNPGDPRYKAAVSVLLGEALAALDRYIELRSKQSCFWTRSWMPWT